VLVSGNNIITVCRECAFQYSIVTRVFLYGCDYRYRVNKLSRLDDYRNELIDMFLIKVKFCVVQNSAQLRQQGGREKQSKTTVNALLENIVRCALPPKGRNQHVCVNDYFRAH